MRIYILLFVFLFAAGYGYSQTSNGSVIGNQTVIACPINSATANGQALIYYPDDYFLPKNANKRYATFFYYHGAGEGVGSDIAVVLNACLPKQIKDGLKPYGIDSISGDTIKWIVISPFAANTGYSYSYPHIKFQIPYMIANYRIDTTCMWIGGISAGARGTWSVPQEDTVLGAKISGIVPISPLGYELATMQKLDTCMKRGLACFNICGDQDSHVTTARAYDDTIKHYVSSGAVPKKYWYYEVPGADHTGAAWDPPFYQASTLWGGKNLWTRMSMIRRTPYVSPTVVKVKKVATTEYRVGYLRTDSVFVSTYYNEATSKVELIPYDLGGKKVIDVSVGFNVNTMIDEDGYPYVSRLHSVVIDKVMTDTSGAAFNGNKLIYGYFYTYFTIKTNGTVWMWNNDDYNLCPGTGPIKSVQISPPGVVFKKLACGTVLMGLTESGEVYEWYKNGSITPTQRTIPRPAIDIFSSHYSYRGCLIPDVSGSQTMGYPYVCGGDYGFWGGTMAFTELTSIKTLWGLTQPLRSITANQNTIHYIDSSQRMWGLGDNANGEVGNGDEKVNKADEYSSPYGWLQTKGTFMVSSPVQIGIGITWAELFTSNTFTFYWYAKDINGNIYFWGRDKSLLGGHGMANDQPDILPNALDRLVPTICDPLGLTPDSFVTYHFTPYTLSAGSDQSVTAATTTLTATGNPSTFTANGKPNITYPIYSYQWTKLSGSGSISSPMAASTGITGMTTGTSVFRVQRRDSQNGVAPAGSISDTVSISVNLNSAPTANAGSDKTITLPTNNVSLVGGGTDPDGTIASYAWSKISGPSTFTIVSPTSISTTVTNLVAGVFVFRLTVTDNSGATGYDDVQVTVNSSTAPIRVKKRAKIIFIVVN